MIIQSLAFSPGTATGSGDPGLAGVFGSHDAQDVSITIMASTVGTHALLIGGLYSSGGNNTITNTATLTVNVPEPSTIAASMASMATVFAVVGIRRRSTLTDAAI